MKREKFNPELLKEELKRFRMIEGYDFHQEVVTDTKKPLILGTDLEEEDDNAAADEIGKDLGVDNGEDQGGDQMGGEPQDGPVAPPAPTNAAPAPPAPETAPPPPAPAPAEDETEVDVTALVQGSEEAKQSADKASFYSAMLLKKLDDLEKRVGDMDKVTRQIDDLEREFKERNPTDEEKLEMQSIVSGPYTQKLSDYWADKEGKYDVMDVNKKREYILTKQNLEQDYSEPEIKKSFDVGYEEEDI